ncbi:ATP-binding protein [Azotosporobacter soli]|uniref:ATP-binding protein n=1 Tax=Azotosporobacter soli TaxID=3055040 RepID=UPI0031FED8C0
MLETAKRLDETDAGKYCLLLNEITAIALQGIQGGDESIRSAIGRLGRGIGVERIGLLLFSADGLSARRRIYWSSERWLYDEGDEFVSLAEYPWLMRQLRNKECVLVADTEKLPAAAGNEQEYFRQHGIRSFAARPLTEAVTGRTGGFWHFDATAENASLACTMFESLQPFETALLAMLQLKEEAEMLRQEVVEKNLLLNNTDIQMWYMLNPTIYGSANAAHAKFFGKTCEEMVHCQIYAIYSLAEANALAEIVLSVFSGKRQIVKELAIRNHRHRERILLISFTPSFTETQEVDHVICSAQDITDLKKMKKVIEANRELQREVAERVLAEARLETAYAELKNAQMQIVQQEKMASIGQLAAGVAHEINNPMGFIISNLASLREYSATLVSFIALQEESLAESAKTSAHQAAVCQRVAEAKRAQQVDYIAQDMAELVQDMEDGANRVKTIVQNLQGFARTSNKGEGDADLNEGLESTIRLIWNELKYKVTLKKELGSLPLVRCNPGQLNQVFMNILLNAAQAIETQGEIKVKTWSESDSVFVSISDNGAGMPPDVLARIFEPFFTTKDVGQGTGLGLSVSYAIIKEHGGGIEVESEVAKGTTFTLQIPLGRAESMREKGGDEDGRL